jgi:predicted Kef-type K+ transport protein
VCRTQELVQVESLAQVGVQLLLFTLGLEFSLSKLRAVRSVALLGECSIPVRCERACQLLVHACLSPHPGLT